MPRRIIAVGRGCYIVFRLAQIAPWEHGD